MVALQQDTGEAQLKRLIRQIKHTIRYEEQGFAALVLADFRDDLRRCQTAAEQLKRCRHWLQMQHN